MSSFIFDISFIVASATPSGSTHTNAHQSASISPVLYYRLPAAALLTALSLYIFRKQLSRPLIQTKPAPIGPPPLLLFAAGFALFFLTHLLGSVLASLIPARHDTLANAAATSASVYAWAILLCTAAWLWTRSLLDEPRSSLRPSNLWWGFLILLPLLPMFVFIADAALLLHILILDRAPSPIAHATLEMIIRDPQRPAALILMLGALIGAPVFEETVYRGFLQSALGCCFKNRWLAIVLSAIVFTLAHRLGTEPVPWHALASIFALGVACGYAFERRGLIAAIALHAAFNAVNLTLALILFKS